MCSGITLLIITPSPIAAAKERYVPVSIRSAMMVWVFIDCMVCTPVIRMTSVPAPRICAPMLFKKVAKSMISGSRAAFSITVVPSARTAAKMALIVAPTETISMKIRAPCKPCGAAKWTVPLSSLTVAPKAIKAFKCWSIGRGPILSPPGKVTVARWKRPNKAPIK